MSDQRSPGRIIADMYGLNDPQVIAALEAWATMMEKHQRGLPIPDDEMIKAHDACFRVIPNYADYRDSMVAIVKDHIRRTAVH